MTETGNSAAVDQSQTGFDLGTPPVAGGGYRVLARKYRPANFDDLIGQEAMVRTVSNAFETGRIPQAWILTGVRGVGKTTTARILARALNYELAGIVRRSWKAGISTCWRWTPPLTPVLETSVRSPTA
jgi:DNA polymerase-3 subunit gamma/tau